MDKTTKGVIIAVKKQWWLRINLKPIRYGSMDTSVSPHIAQVKYVVDGKEYFKSKWIKIGHPLPAVNDSVVVIYSDANPKKSKIVLNR